MLEAWRDITSITDHTWKSPSNSSLNSWASVASQPLAQNIPSVQGSPESTISSAFQLGCKVPSDFHAPISSHCLMLQMEAWEAGVPESAAERDCVSPPPLLPPCEAEADSGPAPKLLSPFSTLRFLPLSRRLKTWPEALQLLPGAPGLESAPKSGASQRQHSLEFSIHGLKTQFLGGGTKAPGQSELLPQAHQVPASSHWAL